MPPLGMLAALDLAFGSIVLLYAAFFPAQAERMQRRFERALGKEMHVNPGHWIP